MGAYARCRKQSSPIDCRWELTNIPTSLYVSGVPRDRGAETRETFVAVATDLIRRNGYTATTVDDICAGAGLTKGAFFHHFKTKDDLVSACLTQWDAGAAALEANGPFQTLTDPRQRALGYMDLYIAIFDDPGGLRAEWQRGG